MLSTWVKTSASLTVMAALFTGCATSNLINQGNETLTRTNQVVLIQDSVIAFGKPAQKLSNLPSDSLVIAGQKNSYILTQGGQQFFTLISTLNPKNIEIEKELKFFSEKNDGRFVGTVPLTYTQVKENISTTDLELYIQNGAQECSTSSDERMQAQRFCFNIELAGVVYPKANNAATLKALSKPYQVAIYTNEDENYQSSDLNPLEKLILFPFAVAVDVISFPFYALEKVSQ